MTDDEKRLLGLANDLAFLLGQALAQKSSLGHPESLTEPFPVRPPITADTRLGDLVGDMRRAGPE